MEWTSDRIRLLREVGLCLSQDAFAKALGFAKRTVGNAERGVHPPSLALLRALDHVLENASDVQRDRFLAAMGAEQTTTGPSPSHSVPVSSILDGLRSVVLGWPCMNVTPIPEITETDSRELTAIMATTAQAHRLYQLADYDGVAHLLPSVFFRINSRADTTAGGKEGRLDSLTTSRVKTAVYIAAAKLATKLGDAGLACVTADRAIATAHESEHPALVGAATYQMGCALLLTGDRALAEQITQIEVDRVARISTITHSDCSPEEALSVRGSLMLLLAVMAARRDDSMAAQSALQTAGILADQLGRNGNWLWTAFGPTNVAIHQLSVYTELGNTARATQIGQTIDIDGLPSVLRGRRSRVHLELGWAAAKQADDAVAVLHLLEAERVAAQAATRAASARELLTVLLARERKGATPGLRGLASRAGLLQ